MQKQDINLKEGYCDIQIKLKHYTRQIIITGTGMNSSKYSNVSNLSVQYGI